jgi:hypothetical protein
MTENRSNHRVLEAFPVRRASGPTVPEPEHGNFRLYTLCRGPAGHHYGNR